MHYLHSPCAGDNLVITPRDLGEIWEEGSMQGCSQPEIIFRPLLSEWLWRSVPRGIRGHAPKENFGI